MSRGFRQQPAAEAGIQGASPAGARPAQLGWTLSRDQTGERWGSYTIHLHHSHGPGEPLWGHLQIISSLADLDAEAHRLWWLGHGVFLLALVAIAGASWWLAGLAMAPLLEAYRRQEQFSADVAHELRTPLANLLAIVEAERGAIADGPHSKTAANLDRVLNQGRRLEQLISDLLLLATLERPCPQTQKQVCDLADITSDVMEDFGELATAAQVELVPGPWAAPALVRGVNSELSRLIINLLSNALQHSPPGGRIGVELEQWGRHPNGGAAAHF